MALDKNKFLKVLDAQMGNVSAACKAFDNMHRQTYYNWMENEEFAKKVHDINERRIDNVETAILKGALEGNTTAQIFFLKCQAKDRGWVEKTEMNVKHELVTWNETKQYLGEHGSNGKANGSDRSIRIEE